MCSDCRVYGLKNHRLTRSDCIYTFTGNKQTHQEPRFHNTTVYFIAWCLKKNPMLQQYVFLASMYLFIKNIYFVLSFLYLYF